MPSKIERSLIQLDKSLVLSLPKGWLDYWEMKKGEKVAVIYNNVVVVIPKNIPEREEVERRLKEVLE